LGFEDALKFEVQRVQDGLRARERWWRHAYVEVGMYGKHLEYAAERLGKDQILILTEEDLGNASELAQKVFSFLGVEALASRAKSKRSNPAAMPRLRALQELITQENVVKKVARVVVPRELRSAVGSRILQLNSRKFSYPAMAQDTRERLAQEFAEDRIRLIEFGVSVPASWPT